MIIENSDTVYNNFDTSFPSWERTNAWESEWVPDFNKPKIIVNISNMNIPPKNYNDGIRPHKIITPVLMNTELVDSFEWLIPLSLKYISTLWQSNLTDEHLKLAAGAFLPIEVLNATLDTIDWICNTESGKKFLPLSASYMLKALDEIRR